MHIEVRVSSLSCHLYEVLGIELGLSEFVWQSPIEPSCLLLDFL